MKSNDGLSEGPPAQKVEVCRCAGACMQGVVMQASRCSLFTRSSTE